MVSLSPRCRLHSERADEFGGEQEEDDFAPQAHQRRSKTDAATRLTLDTTESTERRCVRPRPSGIARPTRRHRDDVTIVPTNGPATPVAQMVSDALVGVSVTASSLVHLSSPRCRIPLYGIKSAARGGAVVAESVLPLACPPGRSRLLRAAWRPCSRGPARRAHGVTRKRQPSATPCTLHATVPMPCTGTDRHRSSSQLRRPRCGDAVKATTR